MIVYSGLKSDFLSAVEEDSIAAKIEEKIYSVMHRRTAQNEFRSWENSLEYMYKVLNDSAIPENSGVAIEYNIPQTSKRVDFIISGYGEKEEPNVVIIELKQWDKVEAVEGQDALVETFTGGAVRKVVHPLYQAWSYAAMIYDYNQNVQMGNIVLHPCAYMHNYRKSHPEKLEQNQYKEYVEDAPVFARGEVSKLRDFIKNSVKSGDNKQILYDIDNGKIKPSKSLQNSIKSMLEGNQEFIMLDEQKVVYEELLKNALACIGDQKKRTIIIKGGPGTGKTVVAINLLAKLSWLRSYISFPCSYLQSRLSHHSIFSLTFCNELFMEPFLLCLKPFLQKLRFLFHKSILSFLQCCSLSIRCDHQLAVLTGDGNVISDIKTNLLQPITLQLNCRSAAVAISAHAIHLHISCFLKRHLKISFPDGQATCLP